MRKDFTPSERVAIGRSIEAELGNRKGQRTDLAAQPPPNLAEVAETRELAAQRAGYGGRFRPMASNPAGP
jgi:ParB family chromosome partitioning protein